MFKCTQCDKSYQRKTHLHRHEATHMQQAASSCPFCKKSFLKPEVTRRHSKTCAKKHDQPLPPAAKPGRKRQSCDECFSAKAACDRKSTCTRCDAIGRQCTFGAQSSVLTVGPCLPKLPTSLSIATPRAISNGNNPFFFLRHFANPAVKKDRLAIGETAKFSMRRNLESIYSHLEDALVPSDPLAAFAEDFRGAEFPFLLPPTTEDSLLYQYPSDALFPSKLSNQLTELMTELVETSKSMVPGSAEDRPLDMMQLTALFGVSNISAFISAFFQSLHWHLPIIHFPTFDPGNVPNPLLLAIFLSGATYTTPLEGASLSPWIFDVAEEYIFRKILNLTTPTSKDPMHILPTVHLVQAALIMEMLQFGRDDMQTRRRIRIMRHPCLVSTIRSLGIFQLKRRTAPNVHDDRAWRILVAEEVCIRIACWVFLADGFLTVCFKNHPALSIFEMDCHLPWCAELWEAEDADSFARIAARKSTEHPIPPLRDVVTQLLETPEPEVPIPWSLSLSAENLLILIYAMSSLAFQTRTGLLKFLPLDTISRGAKNWKRIWDAVMSSIDQKQFLLLGYPKHAEELWWLLTATLDIANQPGASLAYLNNMATDELGNLNDFMQHLSGASRVQRE
ncbi:hypothetical protein N7486_006847 [Penicillium sp. IBT 16267x]|nr:hypothetical protein N7486_006847 [Penicillium sp. IBT 16267x]